MYNARIHSYGPGFAEKLSHVRKLSQKLAWTSEIEPGLTLESLFFNWPWKNVMESSEM